MTTKSVFLIADQILYAPAMAVLEASFAVKNSDLGVTTFVRDDVVAIVVDPVNFSLSKLSETVRSEMRGVAELQVVAPSAILYFASKMDKPDPIFETINALSKFAIAVEEAPVFRVLHQPARGERGAEFRHELTFSSFPADFADVRCDYIGYDGEVVGLDGVEINPATAPVAVPLIFYHSGLSNQVFEPDHLVVTEDDDYEFERMAFDQLMLRFPSRLGGARELADLADRFGLDVADVEEIWKHNRDQWNLVRSKLAVVGCNLPGPVSRDSDDPAFNQFSHLILSGAMKLLGRIDASVPRIRHIGLPIFARNGVTIPLGPEGIVLESENFTNKSIIQRIEMLLPGVLNSDFTNYTRDNSNPTVVDVTE